MQVHVPHDQRGETNKTYQFNCDTHYRVCHPNPQLPPGRIPAQTPPKDPRHIHNQTLPWIGKDQTEPELMEHDRPGIVPNIGTVLSH